MLETSLFFGRDITCTVCEKLTNNSAVSQFALLLAPVRTLQSHPLRTTKTAPKKHVPLPRPSQSVPRARVRASGLGFQIHASQAPLPRMLDKVMSAVSTMVFGSCASAVLLRVHHHRPGLETYVLYGPLFPVPGHPPQARALSFSRIMRLRGLLVQDTDVPRRPTKHHTMCGRKRRRTIGSTHPSSSSRSRKPSLSWVGWPEFSEAAACISNRTPS
jgi:hypothetical protein